MNADQWVRDLRRELSELEAGDMLRRLQVTAAAGPYAEVDGRRLLNLASNDYLGLSQHPRVKAAAAEAAVAYGTGSGASRLISGTLNIHQRVEHRFAEFKHAEAALLFPTGYMANMGVLTALARPGDLIVMDKLCHASLIDGARASGAELRVYPHLNLDKARRLLQGSGQDEETRKAEEDACGVAGGIRKFLVSDSVFSMNGDTTDLPALVRLAEDVGAVLIIDEAHATGVLGPTGAGLAEFQGVLGRVHVTISTASKALGGLGGIVTGSQTVIEYLVNRARPFIYSTAVPPAQAAAIDAALDVVRDEPWRRQRLADLSRTVRTELASRGWSPEEFLREPVTPIVPIVLGEAGAALEASRRLWQAGYWVPAIRPPTVAPGSSRLRISLRADLEDADLSGLLAALDSSLPPKSTAPAGGTMLSH